MPGGPATSQPVAVNIVLAEFNALRSEIDNLAVAHRAMMALNITVVSAVLGFVVANKANPHLLLILPLASAGIGLVYQWYVMHAKHIGDYINEVLRPVLIEYAADDRVFGWEDHLRTKTYDTLSSRLAGRLAYLLLFPSVPTATLIATSNRLDTTTYRLIWGIGLGLLLIQAGVWWSQVRHWRCWT